MSSYGEPIGGASSPNSATAIGSKPIRAILNMFGGVNISTHPNYGTSYIPRLNTPWHIIASQFFLDNPLGTFASYFESAALLVNQKIKIPILENVESGIRQDEISFVKQPQEFEGKGIDLTLNEVYDPDANENYLAVYDSDGKITKALIGGLVTPPDASTSVKGIVEFSEPDGSESGGGRAVQDSDPRLSDDRNPLGHVHDWTDIENEPSFSLSSHNHDAAYSMLSHNHNAVYSALGHTHSGADITSGTVPAAQLPSATNSTKGAVITSNPDGSESAGGKVVMDNDPRMANARTPVTHAHSAGDITSGTLGIARGGTGKTSFTANSLLKGNGTGAPFEIAVGTDGQVLTVVAGSPAWADPPAGGGGGGGAPTDATYVTLTANASLSQERTLAAGTNISINDAGANGAATLNVPDASETVKGAVELSKSDGTESAGGRAVQDNDPRMSNARTPVSHSHTAGDLPSATETALGIVELSKADGTESAGGRAVQDNDPRMSNARTPVSHNHSAAEITSGTLAVGRGGTGKTTFTQHALLKGGASNAYDELTVGSNNQVLTVVSGTPAWKSLDNFRVGNSQATGDGVAINYEITHGFGSAPTYVIVKCTSHKILTSETWDSTKIYVQFASAPPSGGANNVKITWIAI